MKATRCILNPIVIPHYVPLMRRRDGRGLSLFLGAWRGLIIERGRAHGIPYAHLDDFVQEVAIEVWNTIAEWDQEKISFFHWVCAKIRRTHFNLKNKKWFSWESLRESNDERGSDVILSLADPRIKPVLARLIEEEELAGARAVLHTVGEELPFAAALWMAHADGASPLELSKDHHLSQYAVAHHIRKFERALRKALVAP